VTDDPEDLQMLGEFIGTLENVQKIEILPYHKLGVYKWDALGHEYQLKNVEPPSKENVEFANIMLNKYRNKPINA
jgi:pyruvate formate lyase activating enzyme